MLPETAERLAPRQYEVYFAILRIADSGRPVTVRRIAQAIGMRSPNQVQQYLHVLEAKGFIRRPKLPHNPRRSASAALVPLYRFGAIQGERSDERN